MTSEFEKYGIKNIISPLNFSFSLRKSQPANRFTYLLKKLIFLGEINANELAHPKYPHTQLFLQWSQNVW